MARCFARGREGPSIKIIPIFTGVLADVIAETSKDGSKERLLELQTDQGYGETCVPTSINEWSECVTGIVAPKILEVVQLR